jgi:hypothetical protein
MLKSLIKNFIIERIPDRVKLVLIFAITFALGYQIGTIGIFSYETVIKVMCKSYPQ